jgi:hypothetical protein
MARSSTSPAPHLPSWEFAPRPFDCDLLGSAKTGGLEMADDMLDLDLVLARFREQQLQRALRQDTVSLSATSPIAGPALCRSSHSVLDLAGGGTTPSTPTSVRLDKTKGDSDHVAHASACVLGLTGNGATPMAKTWKRVDKTGLLGADDGVILARVLGLAGDGPDQLGHEVGADQQDLQRPRAGSSRAPRAWSPRELAISRQDTGTLAAAPPGVASPRLRFGWRGSRSKCLWSVGHDLDASRQDHTLSVTATVPRRGLGFPLAQTSRLSSRQQPSDGTHGRAHEVGSPPWTTGLARGGHNPKGPGASPIRRGCRPGGGHDRSTDNEEKKETRPTVPSGQGPKRRRFSSSVSPERESSPMTVKTPWSPTEPAVGAVRPRLWCSVGMGSSLEAGAAAGSSTNRSPRGGPFALRRELGAGPAAQQPVGRTRNPLTIVGSHLCQT